MFLIIDQGTTSTKVMLFNLEGKKVDSSQKPFKQIFPNNGWVEHNPEEIIETVISCCNEVIDNNSDQNICSIGCLLYTSPSPRDRQKSRMPSSA